MCKHRWSGDGVARYYVYSADVGVDLIGDKLRIPVIYDPGGPWYGISTYSPAGYILVEDLDEDIAIILAMRAAVFREVTIDMFSPWLASVVRLKEDWCAHV